MAKGIRYEYDYNLENAKKDLTLEGDITFDGISYSDYTQCADLYIPALADINLHLNNLETRNITMSAPDSNKPSIICDSDYSSYFKNVKYIFSSEETEDGKCRLISTERAITSQPNNDTKAVEVNDGENASYQWSRVRATTKTVKDVEADDVIVPTTINSGTYNSDKGVWQPRERTFTFGTPMTYYYYDMDIPFTGNGIVILENPNGSLENIKNTFNVKSNNKNATCRMVDEKLYFEVSDANEKVSLSGTSTTESEIVITVINIADETLEGHNDSSLGAVEDGSYRCYVTWNKDDDVFKYETVSNIFDLVSHIWKYSENGNHVLAYCDGSHTGCEYTGVDKAVSLTLTAEDKEYSGSEYNGASVTDNISSVVTNAVVGNITYYLSDGSTQTTSANSGAAGEGQAPVNVGKYVAKITVSGVTASKAFEIKAPHTHNGVKQNGKAATCTTDGWKDYYQCSCDAFYEDEACTAEITDLDAWKTTEGKIAALGHDFVKIWEKDAESHYHKCTRCNEIKDKAAHTYGEWSVEKQAAEAEAGLRKRSCSVCGYEQTEPLYAITVQNDGNGTASADKTNAVEGETVTLSVAPKENYAFEKWEVTPDTVSITDNQFTMPAGAVKVKAVFRYVPTAEDKLAEAKTAIEAALDGFTATNETKAEDIIAVAEEKVRELGYDDMEVTLPDFAKTVATKEAAGVVTGTLTLKLSDKTAQTALNLPIAKLPKTDADKLAEAKTAIEEILAGITATNDTTKEEIQKKLADGLTAKGIEDVTATLGDFAKTEATTEAAGSITGKITVTSGTESGEVKVNLVIAKLTPSHNHTFAEAWSKDATKHWKECSCGAKAQEENHNINWNITTKATETTVGKMTGICNVCGYTTEKEIPAMGENGSGNIFVESEKKNDYKGKLENEKEVAGKVTLDDEEAALVLGGEDLKLLLKVDDISMTVSTEEKAKIEEKITDNTMGLYLDVSLFKQIGTREKQPVHDTKEAVKIAFEVPENLRNKDEKVTRTYKIMRLHNGEVTMMDGVYDKASGVLSFETDRFSTYALVYKDSENTVSPTVTVNPTVTTEPTITVEPTVTTEPTISLEPTQIPTATAEPTVTTEPTATVTMTPAPTKKPTVTKKPVTPTKIPTKKPTPKPTALPKKTLEKNALSLNAKLKVSQTGSKINVSWGKVSGADGYNVYVQYCGKKFTSKSLNSVKSGKTTKITITKVNGKKLDLKKNFKVYVEAYKKVNGKKITLGKTVTAHIIGRKNTQCTNVKAVKVKKSSYTLKVGKTATIKASTVLVDKHKKQLSDKHAKEFRYATSNKKVATVSGSGKIKAVGKGSCTVYVYARNGYAKKVKVTVK